jgi:hypothetical protein
VQCPKHTFSYDKTGVNEIANESYSDRSGPLHIAGMDKEPRGGAKQKLRAKIVLMSADGLATSQLMQ